MVIGNHEMSGPGVQLKKYILYALNPIYVCVLEVGIFINLCNYMKPALSVSGIVPRFVSKSANVCPIQHAVN